MLVLELFSIRLMAVYICTWRNVLVFKEIVANVLKCW